MGDRISPGSHHNQLSAVDADLRLADRNSAGPPVCQLSPLSIEALGTATLALCSLLPCLYIPLFSRRHDNSSDNHGFLQNSDNSAGRQDFPYTITNPRSDLCRCLSADRAHVGSLGDKRSHGGWRVVCHSQWNCSAIDTERCLS